MNEVTNMNVEQDRNIKCMVCGEKFASIPESLNHEHFSDDAEVIPAITVDFFRFPMFYVKDASGAVLASGEQIRGFLHTWGAKNSTTGVYRSERDLREQVAANGLNVGYDARANGV